MAGFDIYIKERPRTLAIVPFQAGLNSLSADHPILTLSHARPKDTAEAAAIILDIIPWDTFRSHHLPSYLAPATPMPVVGIIGLIHLSNEVFLGVVTKDELRAEPLPHHPIRRILTTCFLSLSTSLYDPVSGYSMPGEGPPPSHPCAAIERYLHQGTFYYAPNHDLTRPLVTGPGALDTMPKGEEGEEELPVGPDPEYWWNGYMMRELIEALDMWGPGQQEMVREAGIFLTLIQGYVGTQEMQSTDGHTSSAPPLLKVSLISRLGCGRAGVRYLTRGIDDEGHVANYVETETVLYTPVAIISHLQLRGSVPLFWEQTGVQLAGHRPTLTRSTEATRPAFERHFSRVLEEHQPIHIIDLLSQREGTGERTLSAAYHRQYATSGMAESLLRWTAFDINAACPGGDLSGAEAMVRSLRGSIESYGHELVRLNEEGIASPEVILRQTGIFRVNCLDCLDRTNVMQSLLSREVLLSAFTHLPAPFQSRRSLAQAALTGLWVENGDALSRIYSGTGALKSGWTKSLSGKASGWMGMLMDAGKSVSRMYLGNVSDPSKQEAVDYLLGKAPGQRSIRVWDETREAIGEALTARADEYSDWERVRLFVGSFNVNGRLPSQPLGDWLHVTGELPQLVVIGIQEIVELTASQIVASDPAKKAEWERCILKCLNERILHDSNQYVLLRSSQLVGTALTLFAQRSEVARIRRVEFSKVKTGLGGMTGNKGAVAARLEWGDTSFCFVCAHLASGMDVLDQRNNEYRNISSWLEFSRGRKIEDHTNIIWCGDFNYRLQGDNNLVRSMATSGKFSDLYRIDQLQKSRQSGLVFQGYQELPLTFPPTYRYNVGTNEYDTSEKFRIPAWTDRILYRESHGRELEGIKEHVKKGRLHQESYDAIQSIRLSDHRPIRALFSTEIMVVDPRRKNRLKASLTGRCSMDSLRSRASSRASTSTAPPTVPAPSNATTTWWDDVVIQEPSKNEESSYQGNPFHEPNAALARPSLSQPTTSSQGAQGKFYRGNGGRRGSDFLSYSTYFIPLSLIFSTSFTSIPG
ncbi:MAG: inositol polyphosphate phosphatase [Piptocephalis tieghemiana]|nr:MAG: inositol polyphosphate phosphatase [Piptocephalis tieghemiana]